TRCAHVPTRPDPRARAAARRRRRAEEAGDRAGRRFDRRGVQLRPEQLHEYLNTPRGAIYGFAPEPPRRYFFAPRTPVDGLWLASSYGGFGGYSGAILSGAAAARAARRAS